MKFQEFPRPLKEKFIFLSVAGIGFLVCGIAASIIFNDILMLFLSLSLALFTIIKSYSFYKTVSKRKYETVSGICTDVSRILIRKQKKVKITDSSGEERIFILNRNAAVFVGKKYTFYFKSTKCFGISKHCLLPTQTADCFLGYEECEINKWRIHSNNRLDKYNI